MAVPEPTELTVQGESLQKLYNQFVQGSYLVNRRYQRKLVWTVEEKEKLIDSVVHRLPIPLVLLAESFEEGSAGFEIIDGLQRLNAIFAFVQNEYAFAGEFFDLETLADTKLLKDEGRIIQRTPVMDRATCLAIANYLLPVSTYRSATEESVDEVFRRINSSGRYLSLQEIRQAGATSELADLVRRLSAGVRGDASLTDIVPLADMPKISITNRDLEYGIQDSEIFWVKQGILPRDAVRESRDEELVLDLVLDMAVAPIAGSGSQYRNSAYGQGSDIRPATSADAVAARVRSIGPAELEERFLAVLDVIRRAIAQSTLTWAELTITQLNPRGIPRYFHGVFIPVYELMFDENLELTDLEGLASDLAGFWNRDLSIPAGGGNWGANRKRPLFDAVKAQLRARFGPRTGDLAARVRDTATKFEIELQMALTEHGQFELKQGFCRLDIAGEFDDDSFEKVLRTASAMANSGPAAVGYVFFGVADDQADAARVRDLRGITPLAVGGFSVTGTQHELAMLGRSVDEHMRFLISRISQSRLEPAFAAALGRSLTPFNYNGYLVWSLNVEAMADPVPWDGRFHIRQGSSTVELGAAETILLVRRFSNVTG